MQPPKPSGRRGAGHATQVVPFQFIFLDGQHWVASLAAGLLHKQLPEPSATRGAAQVMQAVPFQFVQVMQDVPTQYIFLAGQHCEGSEALSAGVCPVGHIWQAVPFQIGVAAGQQEPKVAAPPADAGVQAGFPA